MISESIWKECNFFLNAMLFGIFMTFLYDTIRILRRVFVHRGFLTGLEDICFWLICTVLIIQLFAKQNSGSVRLFAIIASMLGMTIYLMTISRMYVTYVAKVLRFINQKLFCLKKKLTGFVKITIMKLCKR